MTPKDRWLIGLDIDGTLVHDDGFLSPKVVEQVQRVRALGHHVVVSTGRSAGTALPVISDLGISEGFAVASNGAVTVSIDPAHQRGYQVADVVTFDPAPVLTQLIKTLPNAHFAVEDIDGSYRFHRPFPTYSLGTQNFETPLEELLLHPVSRIVVLSPEHDTDEFIELMREVGLHSVSYAIGYTAWLDIAPKGVNKGSALEQLRQQFDVDPTQVLVMGDGRNDIEMFQWAQAGGGYAMAMGQAPQEVKSAATAVTASVEDDGVAVVLAALEGLQFLESN